MDLNQDQIKKIVAGVAEEVLHRMSLEPPKRKVLGVLPGFVFDPKGVMEYLCTLEADAALFEGAQLPASSMRQILIKTPEDRQNLAASLAEYDEIVLVTLSLSLIHTLARADDTVFEAMLAIRPLLWGRTVTLLLDFEAPKFRRSEIFAKLADALDSLEKTGVKIVSLAQKASGPDEPKDLVTEQDIKDAAKSEKKSVWIKDGAIVTQLAQDTAKELGVTIEYS